MNHWGWRGDIHQLVQLFQNTLPIFDPVTGRLYTRFALAHCDLNMSVAKNAVRPASLTVFDGREFLRAEPMIYGSWRQSGLPGSAALKNGLMELLSPLARRKDDTALCMIENPRINQSTHAAYFTLYRIHADRLPDLSDKVVEKLMKICRQRTHHLLQCLIENEAEAAATNRHGKPSLQVATGNGQQEANALA